jgi:hypothetical protein
MKSLQKSTVLLSTTWIIATYTEIARGVSSVLLSHKTSWKLFAIKARDTAVDLSSFSNTFKPNSLPPFNLSSTNSATMPPPRKFYTPFPQLEF